MNQILVIRFSERYGTNAALAAALRGHYEQESVMMEMPFGGIISYLYTEDSFESIVNVITMAECGETVMVVDHTSGIGGLPTVSVIVPSKQATVTKKVQETSIEKRINDLLALSRQRGLNETEKEELRRLLESDPRR